MARWKPWLPARSYADVVGRSFTRRDLQAISHTTRREVMDWVESGIISAEARPGAGVHRSYSWANVIEATAAKCMSPSLRAGTIAAIFDGIRSVVSASGLRFDEASERPGEFVFLAHMADSETDHPLVRVSHYRPGGVDEPGAPLSPYALVLNLTGAASLALRRAQAM